MVKCATYTNVRWKVEALKSHKLRMDFSLKYETFCVQQFEHCFHIYNIYILNSPMRRSHFSDLKWSVNFVERKTHIGYRLLFQADCSISYVC